MVKNVNIKKVIILALQLLVMGILIHPVYSFTSTSKVFLDIFNLDTILVVSILGAYMISFTVSIRWTHVIPYSIIYFVFLITVLFWRTPYDVYLWAPIHSLEYYKFLWIPIN